MDPRRAGRRLLRPLTARLDGLARRLGALEDAERESRAELTALRDRHAALLQTLEARDAHWETRVADATAQVAASVDALTAELPGDAVVRLPADADAGTIGDALASLLDDPGRRDALAKAGRAYQRDRQPADAARALVRAVCDALPEPAGATRRGTS